MTPIVVQGVCKNFGALQALDGISFAVEAGEIFGLLGSNGSGKSTLLRILSLLIAPSRGTISMLGRQVQKKDSSLLRQMGVVFDQTPHYEHLTGFENAWFFARAYEVGDTEIESRLRHFFTALDLWERRDDLVGIYSHGMKRKLALIEALAHHPRVILLDEPSLGLDYHSRMSLYQLLQERVQSGSSIIMATNDVHEARLLCDRVALMRKGRILAVETPDALIGSLGGYAILEMRLDRPIPFDLLKGVPGIAQSEATVRENGSYGIRILARDDPRILPTLLAEITPHASLIGLDIKRPDLGDVMLRFGGGADAS
ncbi:MAG: ABC transporter ATP-binding protein [Methanomicrobiales archaeon]|nr:ABC transporter ATP-binding protein [Methanomicrobiales archaeon]